MFLVHEKVEKYAVGIKKKDTPYGYTQVHRSRLNRKMYQSSWNSIKTFWNNFLMQN